MVSGGNPTAETAKVIVQGSLRVWAAVADRIPPLRPIWAALAGRWRPSPIGPSSNRAQPPQPASASVPTGHVKRGSGRGL